MGLERAIIPPAIPIIPSPSQTFGERLRRELSRTLSRAVKFVHSSLSFFFLFTCRLKKAPKPIAAAVPRIVRGSGTTCTDTLSSAGPPLKAVKLIN